jgi:hypothetical protein
MYALPRSPLLRRSFIVNHHQLKTNRMVDVLMNEERIKQELLAAGVSWYGLHKEESRYLPHIIYDDEHIGGAIYGHQGQESVMLVATDKRVLYVDKKPLFIDEDEVRYEVVSGVELSRSLLGSTITLHTKVKDYKVRTMNHVCAERFARFVENYCLFNVAVNYKQ